MHWSNSAVFLSTKCDDLTNLTSGYSSTSDSIRLTHVPEPICFRICALKHKVFNGKVVVEI